MAKTNLLDELRESKGITPAWTRHLSDQTEAMGLALFAHLFTRAIPSIKERLNDFPPEFAVFFEKYVDAGLGKTDPPRFERLWMEVVLCRSVDGFDAYLTDILRAIFLAKPKTLRSAEKVEVREVMTCGSIQEFARQLAVRKADELSASGLGAILNFLGGLGVRVPIDERIRRATTAAIAVRNVIVHNRGRADAKFLRLVNIENLRVGDLVPLKENLEILCKCLVYVAGKIDLAVVDKFGLQEIYTALQDPISDGGGGKDSG